MRFMQRLAASGRYLAAAVAAVFLVVSVGAERAQASEFIILKAGDEIPAGKFIYTVMDIQTGDAESEYDVWGRRLVHRPGDGTTVTTEYMTAGPCTGRPAKVSVTGDATWLGEPMEVPTEVTTYQCRTEGGRITVEELRNGRVQATLVLSAAGRVLEAADHQVGLRRRAMHDGNQVTLVAEDLRTGDSRVI